MKRHLRIAARMIFQTPLSLRMRIFTEHVQMCGNLQVAQTYYLRRRSPVALLVQTPTSAFFLYFDRYFFFALVSIAILKVFFFFFSINLFNCHKCF